MDDDRDDGVLRVIGGPYDGAEVDAEYLFAGRMPDKLGIRRGGPDWSVADYELDIDATGPYYRFAGVVARARRPVSLAEAERAARRAMDARDEAARQVARSRELQERTLASKDALRRAVAEAREARERVRRRRGGPN